MGCEWLKKRITKYAALKQLFYMEGDNMIKVYMVFINSGFGGIKYFQEKENAENYIKENGGTLEIESATPQEYFNLDFSDPIKEDYF